MTDQPVEGSPSSGENTEVLAVGGLEFDAQFRAPSGATLRVFGDVGGSKKEILRFDDFVDGPHYHVPGEGPSIDFDREANGEPLEWLVSELRDDLGPMITRAGYADLLPRVDLGAISESVDKVRRLMEDCVPDGFIRVPGIGLQRVSV
jgi:hypothetical protein